jgi:PTS system cellobiose-specific IIB component
MKICLVCNTGLSTSYLKQKLIAYGEENQLELSVDAIPYAECVDYQSSHDVDVFLMAPQVAFMQDNLRQALPDKNVKIAAISVPDYGMQNAANIMASLQA